MTNDISIYSGIFDIIGTVAFAVSGAATAIKKRMDVFGMIVLAVITAAGGGVLRDVILGDLPPKLFKDPHNAAISAISAVTVFILYRLTVKHERIRYKPFNDMLMWFDAVGLAAFTVTGVVAGLAKGYAPNRFLLIFLGTVTGVGGGALRDITVQELPMIFVKQIYACASVAGAVLMVCMYPIYGYGVSAAVCFAAVLILRGAGIIFNWNLPSAENKEESRKDECNEEICYNNKP